MTSDVTQSAPAARAASRKLPPVAEIAVGSIVLMLAGGVYLAAHLPGHPVLALPVALVAAGAAVTAADIGLLSRIRPFAWPVFFLVFRWALLAYLVIAGLLAFVFIHDHTPAAPMAVLAATLAVFAVDVPLILAFTVARFQDPALPAHDHSAGLAG
jgi:ABC-type polysaccharide/polyol phosphate export permease